MRAVLFLGVGKQYFQQELEKVLHASTSSYSRFVLAPKAVASLSRGFSFPPRYPGNIQPAHTVVSFDCEV